MLSSDNGSSSLLTPVPANNEEPTASANGDGAVLTVHLADKFTRKKGSGRFMYFLCEVK